MCVSKETAQWDLHQALTVHGSTQVRRGGVGMPREKMNHGNVCTLKTASGFRSVVSSTSSDTTTRNKITIFTYFTPPPPSSIIKKLLLETLVPQLGHKGRLWPPFQLDRSRGSPHILEKRKALVTQLGFFPARHKTLTLLSAHSHSTANKCDLLFPSHCWNKKAENSPLPCQLNKK